MASTLVPRPWLPGAVSTRVGETLTALDGLDASGLEGRLDDLIADNGRIHDEVCLNLNPATNRMNPRAERMLAAQIGSRASLGYPGEKYETGLEAIEQIEIIAAELAARVFHADYAEVRVGSGALANLYAFMACCEPGDTIMAPPGRSPATSPTTPREPPGCTGYGPSPPPSTRSPTPSTSTPSPSSRGPYGHG